MRNRLHVSRAITVLDEEALIVFEQIWSAYHRVVEAISVVVLDHLPDALLEIRCRDNREIRTAIQPALRHGAVRCLHNE